MQGTSIDLATHLGVITALQGVITTPLGVVTTPQGVVHDILLAHSVCAGVAVGELPESTQDVMIEATRSCYQHFLPLKKT